jgi:hypothetical protein
LHFMADADGTATAFTRCYDFMAHGCADPVVCCCDRVAGFFAFGSDPREDRRKMLANGYVHFDLADGGACSLAVPCVVLAPRSPAVSPCCQASCLASLGRI